MHYRTGLSHYFEGMPFIWSILSIVSRSIVFYLEPCSYEARYLGGHGYLRARRYPGAHLFLCFESLFVHMHETGITQGAEISRLDYSGIATLGHAHRIITYLIILWARWGTYPSNGLVRSLPITSRDS